MVVVPNYALAPQVTLETIALQVARAVAWTWRNASLYGGDPSRIVAEGRGEADPLSDNATPEHRDENRRIEIVLNRAR